jgi:hypothetical protein
MKSIKSISLVLGLVGISLALYHLIETSPNLAFFESMTDKSDLERDIWKNHRSVAHMQVYGMWASGGLGLILAAWAFFKGEVRSLKEERVLLAGGLLSLATILVSFSTIMAGKIG